LNTGKELKEIFSETKRLISAYEEMGLEPPMLPKGALDFIERRASKIPPHPRRGKRAKGKQSLKFPENRIRRTAL
jgi:hypothetical protein